MSNPRYSRRNKYRPLPQQKFIPEVGDRVFVKPLGGDWIACRVDMRSPNLKFFSVAGEAGQFSATRTVSDYPWSWAWPHDMPNIGSR